jgi:putative peptidoglycan lipid II flippase
VLARRGQWRPDARLRLRSVRIAAAAAAMGLALWGARLVVPEASLHGMARIGALAMLIGVGLAADMAAAMVFGAGDWRELGRMMRRRRVAAPAVDTAPRR